MTDTFLQHPDMVKYAFGLLLAIISGYTAFTLNNINESLRGLYDRIISIERELYVMKGKQEAQG